jgi:chemotaxis protein methyltransferase CheR
MNGRSTTQAREQRVDEKELMTHEISDQLLSRFSEFVTARFGLHFPRKRWSDLERGLVCAAREFGLKDAAECIRWLTSTELTRSEFDTLAGCLTIGETYFFREPNGFEALEKEILPALISARRGRDQRLRIWSAGCASGEEPYSLAMLLQRLIPDLPQWNVTILATDINPEFLRKAARGVYGEWSFRGVPAGVKEKYFTRTGEGTYALADSIRKMVTLAPLNLAEDPYPSLVNNTNALDIIFCRNVLMYFAPRQIDKVIDNFHHSLVPGGWLVVSPCETSATFSREFEAVHFHHAVFYRNVEPGKASALPGEQARRLTPPPRELKTFPEASPGNEHHGQQVPLPGKAHAVSRQVPVGDATGKLEEIPAGAPEGPSAALLTARSHANCGNFAEALEWAGQAIAADKLDPEAHYLQALIFQEQGADDAAIASLKRALYVDHAFVLAHFALANLFVRRGKAKEAARQLDNASHLLQAYSAEDILPGSDGLSARRLAEIVASTRTGIVPAGTRDQG